MKNLVLLLVFAIFAQCYGQSLPREWHKIDTAKGRVFELSLRSSEIYQQDSVIFVAFKEIVNKKETNYLAVVFLPMDNRYIESDCIEGKSYNEAIKLAKAKIKEPRFIDTRTSDVRDTNLFENFILPHAARLRKQAKK